MNNFEYDNNKFYYNVNWFVRLVLSYDIDKKSYNEIMKKHDHKLAETSMYKLEFPFNNNDSDNIQINKIIDNELASLSGKWDFYVSYENLGKFNRVLFFSDKKDYIKLKLSY